MLAKGNSNPEICVQNLLKTVRGEVPYERIKGIDRTIFDAPSKDAANDLAADAEFVIKTYEPRVNVDDIEIEAANSENGGFKITAKIKNK